MSYVDLLAEDLQQKIKAADEDAKWKSQDYHAAQSLCSTLRGDLHRLKEAQVVAAKYGLELKMPSIMQHRSARHARETLETEADNLDKRADAETFVDEEIRSVWREVAADLRVIGKTLCASLLP